MLDRGSTTPCSSQITVFQGAPELITLYKAIGTLIRARIAILHLEEAPVRDPAKWPKGAAEYLAIASRRRIISRVERNREQADHEVHRLGRGSFDCVGRFDRCIS